MQEVIPFILKGLRSGQKRFRIESPLSRKTKICRNELIGNIDGLVKRPLTFVQSQRKGARGQIDWRTAGISDYVGESIADISI